MTEEDLPPASGPETDQPSTSGTGGDGGLTIEVDESSPAAQIARLESALAKAEQEKKDNWDKYVRTAADLENFRRRTKRDLDDAKAETKTRVLKEMLPVVDNLERALAAATGDDPVIEGVRLVLRQFMHALERLEVHPVDADGKPFDPNVHEAIGQQESDAPPGSIVNVLQKGYKMGDRLLRPSLVVVAKPKSSAEAPGPGPSTGGEA
ncbi:MAG TPA: nucleotide exchange factor GrpE [Kofleriaceae bacterium]|jgi:molecular chaperone GrpE|nr:nucleotide exchange factor GrpE [Kofleriaceae bacterium]